MELIKTGVEGLDSILKGGFVRNSTILLSGNPGTGKSLLGMQYLYNGVQDYDEKGIYLSFEEDVEDLSEAANSIGFEEWDEMVENEDIMVYGKENLLREKDFSSALMNIMDELDTSEYKRLVMDSLTMFSMFFEDEQERRTYLLKFSDILKHNGLTSLLISESQANFPEREYGLENFLTDGDIHMIQTPTQSGVNRYIWVAKMRKQDINSDIFPLEIQHGGITVHENASGFSHMEGGLHRQG